MSSKKGIVFEVNIPEYHTQSKKDRDFDSIKRKAGVDFKSTKQTRHNDKVQFSRMSLD